MTPATLTNPPPRPPAQPARGLILAVIVLLAGGLLGAQLYAMAARGPWYDEFYTFYVTDRRFDWAEALTRHWLADNHPPLFYALSRATDWLGDTIEARRRVNALIALAALGAAALALRRDGRRHLPLAALFMAFLVAQGPAIVAAAELRSYFLSFTAGALLVLLLTAAWLDGGAAGKPRQFMLAGALLIAFNTHIATSLLSGALLAAFVGAALLRRNFALLRALL